MTVIDDVVSFAAEYGVRCSRAQLLRDRANMIVHLSPSPVVARIPALVRTLRPRPQDHLATELAIATHLGALDAPVVTPSAELPPGPHQLGSRWVSFWTYLDLDHDAPPRPTELAETLSYIQCCLRDFGEHADIDPLHDRGPLADLRAGTERLALTAPQRARLMGTIERFDIESAQFDVQPLHGDAHAGNCVRTSRGVRWLDFEDAWRGPRAWDHACLAGPQRVGDETCGDETYGDERYAAVYAWCVRLRQLHRQLWGVVLGEGDDARLAKRQLTALQETL